VESIALIIGIAVVILLAVVGLIVGLLRPGKAKRQAPPPPKPGTDYAPGVGDDAEEPRDSATRTVDTLPEPGLVEPEVEVAPEAPVEPAPTIERPAEVAGRLARLRARLVRSNNALGKGLLALLSRDTIDEETWDEVEETLLTADLGVGPTTELVDRLRERVQVLGTRDPQRVHDMSPRSCSSSWARTWTGP